MSDWLNAAPPRTRIGPAQVPHLLWRLPVMALVTFGGLGLLLLLRLFERPLHGPVRPWTPAITQAVCRINLAILGIGYRVEGRPMAAQGAIVANHGSWLDIFVLNACQRVYFVSKAEVARWFGIGWLARATGTVFITRDPKEAKAQQAMFETRLATGHRLLFFPEGTSTDARRVLPFKSTLFAAFLTPAMAPFLRIQPVSVIYHAPPGADPRFYGWWDDMTFGPHFLKVLAQHRQGRVEVVFHEPLRVADFASRKDLARACEDAVRSALEARLGPAPADQPRPSR